MTRECDCSYVNYFPPWLVIPGLPLDGGNILKALVWKITGNFHQGVVVASRVGQVLGWVAVASGLIPLLLYGSFGGVWNLLIGWFLLQNAGRMVQSARVQAQMTGLTAEDAVSPNSPIVSANLSLREFADQVILGNNWQRFLVTNHDGQLLGAITVDHLKTVSPSVWSETTIAQLMQPIEQSLTVESNQPLLEAVKLLEEKKLPALPVVRANGVVVGLLEKASVLSLLQAQSQAKPA